MAVLMGCSDALAMQEIRRIVLPWRTRLWLRVRGLVSDQAGLAEQELPEILASCVSSSDIEEVFLNYRNDPCRLSAVECLLVGRPSLRRVLRFHGQLKDGWRSRSQAPTSFQA